MSLRIWMPGDVEDQLVPVFLQRRRAFAVTTTCLRESLELHVVPQHQLLGVRVQIHLLVHPVRYRIAVVAIPAYKTGLKRQNRAR